MTTTSAAPSTTLPTTSSTIPTVPSTTTTTLLDRCASIAAGPTFASLECRLTDVARALSPLGATSRAAALRNQLARASGSVRNAYAVCAGGDAKTGKKAFKGVVQALGRLHSLLTAKAAKAIPVRAELLTIVDPLRRDARSLRNALSCPGDAVAR